MSFGVVAASYLAAVPMTPADVSGLALWLKADTISGLTDGANVIAWQDTTNSVTAESHAALVPTYAANNTPIGLPAVRFSTSNSPLDVAGTATPTHTLPYVVGGKRETLPAGGGMGLGVVGGVVGGGDLWWGYAGYIDGFDPDKCCLVYRWTVWRRGYELACLCVDV